MIEKLKSFSASMAPTPDGGEGDRRIDCWWVVGIPPLQDFNKEIYEPGFSEKFPDGCVGIRCDDDFWAVAVLPLEFRGLSVQEIVSVLWPDIEDPEFNPDAPTRCPQHIGSGDAT